LDNQYQDTPHILVVDDEESIRKILDNFIRRFGYTSYTASNANEALEILKENEITIVITDIMMPGISGLDLTGIIKEKYSSDVIIMTGFGGDFSYEEAISKGASDFVIKPVHFEELLIRLKRVLKERMLTEERSRMIERLQTLAITDGLTQLYNSRHFYYQLKKEIDRSIRYEHNLSLLLMDIDHFKVYNDTYGHLEGDKVLTSISRIIKSCLRTMDSAYRYGGEEFTVVLPETNGAEAITVADRIKESISKEVFKPVPDEEVSVTISIGVSEYSHGEDLSSFVQRTDKAMYQSKHNGRNRISTLSVDD